MDPNPLFTMALGPQSLWGVKSLQFSKEDKRLDILVDFERGATFPFPECGRPAKAHDTEKKREPSVDSMEPVGSEFQTEQIIRLGSRLTFNR